jgi:hypothetical protein
MSRGNPIKPLYRIYLPITIHRGYLLPENDIGLVAGRNSCCDLYNYGVFLPQQNVITTDNFKNRAEVFS